MNPAGGNESSGLSNLVLLGIAAAGGFGACAVFMGCVFAVITCDRRLQRNRIVALSGVETAAAASSSAVWTSNSRQGNEGGNGGSGGERWAAPRMQFIGGH